MFYSSKIGAIAMCILAASHQVLATPSLVSSHLATRQSSAGSLNYTGPAIGTTCTDACANMVTAFASCNETTEVGIAKCVCTNATVTNFGNCMTCLVASQGVSKNDAQTAMNGFTTECTADGFSFQSIQISGASNGMHFELGMLTAVTAGVFALLL